MTPQQLRSIANQVHEAHETLGCDISSILDDCKRVAKEGFFAHLVTFTLGTSEKDFKKTEIDYIVRHLQDMGFALEMQYCPEKEEVDIKIEW